MKIKKNKIPLNARLAKYLQEPGRYAFFAWVLLLLISLNPDNVESRIVFLFFTILWIFSICYSILNKRSMFSIDVKFPKIVSVGKEFEVPIKIKKEKGFSGLWNFRFTEESKKEKNDKLMRKALFNTNSDYWYNRYALNDSNDYGDEQLSAIAFKDISVVVNKKEVDTVLTGRGRKRGVVKINYLSWGKKDLLGWTQSGKIQKINPIEIIVIPDSKKMPVWPSDKANQASLRLLKNKTYAKTTNNGDNFIGIREARREDPLKYTHWKSWAKTGKRWVIEKELEVSPKMSLLVDLVLDETDVFKHERFEQMLEMLVGQALNIRDDKNIEWVFMGESPIKVNTTGKIKWQKVLYEIALAESVSEDKMNEKWLSLDSYLKNIVAIRLLTTRSEQELKDWIIKWKKKGIVVDVIRVPMINAAAKI